MTIDGDGDNASGMVLVAKHDKLTKLREYSVRHRKKLGDSWTTQEFRHIAEVQAQREDLLAQRANGVLFCDTDVFTTACFANPTLTIVALAARLASLLRANATLWAQPIQPRASRQ